MELTLTHFHILNEGVDEDHQVDQGQEANEAGNHGPHPFDSLEDVVNEIVAESGKIHVIEVNLYV